jgi:hypothetical protein
MLGVMETMKADDEAGNPIRTWLRGMLGMSDPHEPAPWAGPRRGSLRDYIDAAGRPIPVSVIPDPSRPIVVKDISNWAVKLEPSSTIWAAAKNAFAPRPPGEAPNVLDRFGVRPPPAGETPPAGERRRGTTINDILDMWPQSSYLGSSPGQSRGTGGLTLNQKTSIHIEPGLHADSTARAVADYQTRVNADLLRNAKAILT